MKSNSVRLAELTAIAHSAADMLRECGVAPGPYAAKGTEVSFAQALNAVGDPIEAAVVEREWLRKNSDPLPPMEKYAETLAAMDFTESDMLAHLGPNWTAVIADAQALMPDGFVRFAESVTDPETEVTTPDLAAYEERARTMGLDTQWERSQLLVDALEGSNLGPYLASHSTDITDPSGRKAAVATRLLRETIAKSLVRSSV